MINFTQHARYFVKSNWQLKSTNCEESKENEAYDNYGAYLSLIIHKTSIYCFKV